ncbi:MAG TPA: VOC family protein [Chryseosolibacter sp.]
MENLSQIWPFFIVANLARSVLFYRQKLGFEVRHMGPEGEPFWAIVGRDNISIMLKAVAPEIKPVPNHTRHVWAPWDAYIATTDPDTLFEEYRTQGVQFHKPLHVNSDQIKGFEIEDADGYVLFFGRPDR